MDENQFKSRISELGPERMKVLMQYHKDLENLHKKHKEKIDPNDALYAMVGYSYQMLIAHFNDFSKAKLAMIDIIDDVLKTIIDITKMAEEHRSKVGSVKDATE